MYIIRLESMFMIKIPRSTRRATCWFYKLKAEGPTDNKME